MYSYLATVRRWVDGDTLDVSIDLGFGVLKVERVRLNGVNCPESNGETKDAGIAAKTFSESLAPVGVKVALKSYKADATEKFGRYLATVFLDDGRDVSAELIRAGHGKEYHGERR